MAICVCIQSEDEREMCSRTIYCTNVDKNVNTLSQLMSIFHFVYKFLVLRLLVLNLQATEDDVKIFFESACGEVSLEPGNYYYMFFLSQ